MRGLAAFAMGGRARAFLLAVASAGSLLFAWFAAALIALVTLRKGVGEGFLLLLWSSLPAFVLLRVTGDSTVLGLIVGTGLLAMVLRATASLALTALATTVVALVTATLTEVFAGAMLDELARAFGELFQELQARAGEGGGSGEGTELQFRAPTSLLLAGMIGTANGLLCFLCLILGRAWQAGLYNPGGFGAEFRALRFPPAVAWGLGLAALALISVGFDWRSWGAALLLPLTIAGFALLHARARHRSQSSFWLGAVYVGWVVFDAAKLALIGLALADALYDFRRRWVGGAPRTSAEDTDKERETSRPDAAPDPERDRDRGMADRSGMDAGDGGRGSAGRDAGEVASEVAGEGAVDDAGDAGQNSGDEPESGSREHEGDKDAGNDRSH